MGDRGEGQTGKHAGGGTSARTGFPGDEKGFDIAAIDPAIFVDIGLDFAATPSVHEGFDIAAVDTAIGVEVGDAAGGGGWKDDFPAACRAAVGVFVAVADDGGSIGGDADGFGEVPVSKVDAVGFGEEGFEVLNSQVLAPDDGEAIAFEALGAVDGHIAHGRSTIGGNRKSLAAVEG